MTGLNPFDWYGGAFLTLYIVLFVLAVAASFAISARLRPDGTHQAVRDENELAVLGGNGDRLAETAITRLLALDALSIDKSRQIHRGRGGQHVGDLDRDILALDMPLRWDRVRQVADRARARIENNLVRRGLMMEAGEGRMMALWACAPLVLLIGFGFVKVQVGLARGRPVEFLVILLVVTALVAVFRFAKPDLRTRAGIDAWQNAKRDAGRLKQAPTGLEMGKAVALFGTGVLATSAFGDFHRLRASTGDGGGTGSDSGSGDSGCGGGGGGCGGCGS